MLTLSFKHYNHFLNLCNSIFTHLLLSTKSLLTRKNLSCNKIYILKGEYNETGYYRKL